MTTRSRFKGVLAATFLGLTGTLTGCGGVTYAGRVVSGPASIATVVPESDPRLDSATGVEGVLIEFKDEKQNLFGSGVSGADGKFAISIPTAEAPTRPTVVRSTGPGLVAGETTLYLPRSGGQLLINVKRSPGSPAGATPHP